MRVVVAGSSGMIGRPLVIYLRRCGHEVVRLMRDEHEAREPDAAGWQPARGELEASVLDGADAVVNLCGRNVGEARWTASVKLELYASRIESTRLLTHTIAGMASPPRVFVNASATGFYGDRDEEELHEGSHPGDGFLANLTRDWEAAALPVLDRGVRLVLPRLGMVIGPEGALGRMLPIFKLGLGGPLGSGRQWWPWISLDDAVGAIGFLLDPERDQGAAGVVTGEPVGTPEAQRFDDPESREIAGPVNLVAPSQVRCRDLVAALGEALGRPTLIRAHAFALRLVAGEMADELLLASARVDPGVLVAHRYRYRSPVLEDALRRVLEARGVEDWVPEA